MLECFGETRKLDENLDENLDAAEKTVKYL